MTKFHQSLPVLLTLFCLSIAGIGCGDDAITAGLVPATGGTGTPGVSGEVTVSIAQGSIGKGKDAFGKNPLQIPLGTIVTWKNDDSVPHTATSDTGVWDSGTLQPGQSFSRTFNEVGTFPYFCAIHGQASMSGEIEVIEPGASPSPRASASPSPSPSASPMAGMSGGYTMHR